MNFVEQIAVVLIGHGAPATDCPPELVGQLMSLEWRGNSHGHSGHEVLKGRVAQLDAKIRNWPRHADNDPYKAGLERLGGALRPLLPTKLLSIGYNEFCCPSIPEAIEEVIQAGATRILVIPSMLTPGGVHSEVDIPRAVKECAQRFPKVAIEYVWPFDLGQVAKLLVSHIQQTLKGTPP